MTYKLPPATGYLPVAFVSPLHAAVVRNNARATFILLSEGADPNVATGQRPLLHIALLNKHIGIAKMLRRYGAMATPTVNVAYLSCGLVKRVTLKRDKIEESFVYLNK